MPIIAPHILIPKKEIDLTKWSVIACDQFTSESKYWEELGELVKNVPSALHITLPEIYLDKANDKTIENINTTMERYLSDGIFQDFGECFILTVRSTPFVKRRLGLIIAVDLEQYDYQPGNNALIRATEGTVLERIPPRKKIRINAPIELPHVMLLFDDKQNKIIGDLYSRNNELEKIYDFDLNMGGGHITGYKVTQTDEVIEKFHSILGSSKMMFAVGDGNHSLATAKACWDTIKQKLTDDQKATHPARYALVEAVNIYDPGLQFEAIHRVVFDASTALITELKSIGGTNICQFYQDGRSVELRLPQNSVDAVTVVQEIIDKHIEESKGKIKVDYVHGVDNMHSIVDQHPGSIGVTLPTFYKSLLFDYIQNKGTLPRKTFSMGEGKEKRYYLEAKLIKT